ncbi:MAG: hypothetical protein ACD_28C00297G0001 [uncultured bacterium]|nr:MAG: hypothetical protein ACD_28C00297G0001 [uncultured bacterium]
MKGADVGERLFFFVQQPFHTLADLLCRFLSEADGKDMIRVHFFFLDEVDDSSDKRHGFSTAGPGHNEEGTFGGGDGGVLGGVEFHTP